MDKNNSVLLMLSGGRDSFLSACRLLDDPHHYSLKMVTYDNCCSWQSGNAKLVADRLIQMYGEERVEYLGVYKIGSVIREFFLPYFNMKTSEQLQKFGETTPSQIHCLICRTSMYIYSIYLCRKYNIHYIAEGGRKIQEFVIELPGMLQDRYKTLLQDYGLDLLTPVYDLVDNWERDNELLRKGFLSKSMEPKCMIGVPVCGSVDQSVIDGIHAFYDEAMLPKIKELLSMSNPDLFFPANRDYDELNG